MNQALKLQQTTLPSTVEVTSSLDETIRLGELLAQSGFFADSKQAAQCVVKILAGRELGIQPISSMVSVHIVNGKPVLAANLIASLIKNKRSGYNYRILEMSDKICEIEFFEGKESIGKSSFSMAEAQTAGITGKDVWKKFPKNMLFARAISNGAKWFCPDIFNGAAVYTPEEMDVEVDGDGEVIEMPKLKLREVPKEAEERFTPEQTEARAGLKKKINELFVGAGVDEKKRVDALKFIDNAPVAKHDEIWRRAQTAAIKQVFTDQNWDAGSVETYLEQFSVDGLDNASSDQLDAIIEDMTESGMILKSAF